VKAAAKLDHKVLMNALMLIALERFIGIKGSELGERVRQLFEDAGGIFPKLGQNLAERPDLIPNKAVRDALQKLQSNCPSMEEDDLSKQLKSPGMENVDIDVMNRTPCAAASIGQVHELNPDQVIKMVNLSQKRKIEAQKELVNSISSVNLAGKAGGIAKMVKVAFD